MHASFAAKDYEVWILVTDELQERRLSGLRHALGPIVLKALDDPDVVEIMLNDDGKLFIESLGNMDEAGVISPDSAMAILSQVASAVGVQLSKENPSVSGVLPFRGERFQGVAPPVAENASFAIRKPADRIFILDEYVRKGVLTFMQAEILRKAILNRRNILVSGGTGTGKTTFVNALLYELAKLRPQTRMVLMEDTRELQCKLRNRLFLRKTEWSSMDEIGVWINRLRPDSITVGEVREGGPALSLLKNWNTGHPGGFGTVHADSGRQALTRLDQLIQEVSAHPQRILIGEAVNVVVYLERNDQGARRIKEILEVKGYDQRLQEFVVEEIK